MHDFQTQFKFHFEPRFQETQFEVVEGDCLEAALHLKLDKGFSLLSSSSSCTMVTCY